MAAGIDNPAISKIFVCPAPPLPDFPVAKKQETETLLNESQSSISQNPYAQPLRPDHKNGDDLQLVYLTRLVQACYLLDLAILNRWARFHTVANPHHCDDLDPILTTFASAVLQEGNVGQGKNCTCLAICVK